MTSTAENKTIPMFQQIERELAEEIQRNIYRPGDRLPSENDLARRFNVHRLTVRKALGRLQERDLVVRYQGKGTYIKAPTLNVALSPQEGFFSSLVRGGTTPIKKLISFERCVAMDEVRSALNIQEPVSPYCLRRLYFTEDGQTPIALTESYFRPEFEYSPEQANEFVVYQL
ncbi:MAG: GntR family transcriptional regulator, partial [Firmicutes bacterium]|nr:GntR family transcriptional regulator [Bacillota bacterium]